MIFKRGYKITQLFGERPSYYAKFGLKGHEGLDLVPKVFGDNDIEAVEDGVVVRDVDNPRSGAYGIHTVILNSENHRAWWYCHLAQNDVSLGQLVSKGQKIGVMGDTGNTSGAHLHLGLRIADEKGNPTNIGNGYFGYVNPLDTIQELQVQKIETSMDDKTREHAYFFDLLWHAWYGQDFDTSKVTQEDVSKKIEETKWDRERAYQWDLAVQKAYGPIDSRKIKADELVSRLKSFDKESFVTRLIAKIRELANL